MASLWGVVYHRDELLDDRIQSVPPGKKKWNGDTMRSLGMKQLGHILTAKSNEMTLNNFTYKKTLENN